MKKSPISVIFSIIGAIVAIAGAAYLVYRFFEKKNEDDDFDCDNYVECPCDDDDDEDAVEAISDAAEAVKETVKDAVEEITED